MEVEAPALPKPFGKNTLITNHKHKKQGKEMSTQINQSMVDLDATSAAFLTAYIEAKDKVKEWTERADIARQQVEAAMGDCEIGLVNGKESVRWTTVESRRIDTKKIRELLSPEQVAGVEAVTITRRFTIVEE